MFRFLTNRELRIRVAKSDPSAQETPDNAFDVFDVTDPDYIEKMFKSMIKSAAITFGCVLVVSTVLHTLSEILINAANSDND